MTYPSETTRTSPRRMPLTIAVVVLMILSTGSVLAQAIPSLFEDPLGAPLRVRDYTFPSYLTLNFAPQPAKPLGKGRWAFEGHYSLVNNFQVSDAVEQYLEASRSERRPLDAADADFILGLPGGDGFYIDGEFEFVELVVHYGVTSRLDLGVGIQLIDYSGGVLDGAIFDFHDEFGFGQQGRDFVRDDQFQIVVGQDGEGLVVLDGPPSGGISDPNVFLRYYLGEKAGWHFNLGAGFKVPLADEPFLSSGSWDFGLQVTADRRWRRNALMMSLAFVEAGRFRSEDVDPPVLPSLHVSWIHGFGKSEKSRFVFQVLMAEHAFSDLFDSDIADLETQVTIGFKRATSMGVFGLGLTENLFAHDNTPDVGLHFSWGFLTG